MLECEQGLAWRRTSALAAQASEVPIETFVKLLEDCYRSACGVHAPPGKVDPCRKRHTRMLQFGSQRRGAQPPGCRHLNRWQRLTVISRDILSAPREADPAKPAAAALVRPSRALNHRRNHPKLSGRCSQAEPRSDERGRLPQVDVSELISLSEAADICGLTSDHLGLLARRGHLPARKIGRNWVTTRAAVEEYMRDPLKRSRDPRKHSR